jgi:hypothetical protein
MSPRVVLGAFARGLLKDAARLWGRATGRRQLRA